MQRFPAFRVPSDTVAVVQPEGGFLEAEPAVEAMVGLAQAEGAEIRCGETIAAIEPRAGGVRITTDRGVVEAGVAIVALGAWVKALLPQLAVPIRITRQVMAWFAPADPAPLRGGRLPVFLIESRHGIHYGFPPLRPAPSRSPSITTAIRASIPMPTTERSRRRMSSSFAPRSRSTCRPRTGA